MGNDDVQKAINRLDQATQALRDRMTEVEADLKYSVKSADKMEESIKALDIKLDVIRQDIAQAKGAGTAAKWVIETFKLGTVGGLGAWLASTFSGNPPPGS